MASYVQNIINAAYDPKITIFIAARAVAREVIAFKFAPILLPVTRVVAVDSAQHRRPRPANDQFSADIRADFLSSLIDDSRIDAEEWKRAATRLGWRCAWKRGNHDRARFGLPPRVHYRTTSAAGDFMVPHPCFRIDGFTD